LIALAANLGDDSGEQAHVGDLFARAQDYEHALAEYVLSLKSDHDNQAALAGAGRAAFQLGRYSLAYRYLEDAVVADPADIESAARLKTAELVMQMDPFQRQLSVAHRDRVVMAAFAAAGERIHSCSPVRDGAGSCPRRIRPGVLLTVGKTMRPQVTLAGLRRDPDLVESAMQLVFDIERQTNATCGHPNETDSALLLISRLHEGN